MASSDRHRMLLRIKAGLAAPRRRASRHGIKADVWPLSGTSSDILPPVLWVHGGFLFSANVSFFGFPLVSSVITHFST